MAKTRIVSPGIPNHKLYRNLQLNSKYLSNDGDDEGIRIDDNGVVTASSQIDVGNMSLTTSEIDISSGDLTIDVSSAVGDKKGQLSKEEHMKNQIDSVIGTVVRMETYGMGDESKVLDAKVIDGKVVKLDTGSL